MTVLGSAGSHPAAGRMCSGYLVEADGVALLLDAGNGSTANLQKSFALRDLDAVVVSHRHLDHCVDLIGAFYVLNFDPTFQDRLPLYAAAEVYATLATLLSGDSPMRFDAVFSDHPVGHEDRQQVGPMALSFARSVHPPPTVSTRIEVDGRSLVYSGDTAGGDDLVRIARNADVFLCESTWAGDPDDHPPGVHLTAGQAAEVARDAEVDRLVLTHIAGGTDRDRVLSEASAVFDGRIDLADDGDVYDLS